MKIIAVMNQKGGIGKTMTAAAIAYIMGEEKGKKVLICDADQQGNISLLYDRFDPEGQGMSELLENHQAAGGAYSTTDLIRTTPYGNIDIIPANGYLMRTNMTLLQEEGEDQILRFAADLVIVPVKIGGFEIEAAANMDSQLASFRSVNPDIRMKVLMTMRQKNQTTLQVEEWLKTQSGHDCFATAIRRSIIAEKSTVAQVPLPKFSKNCIVTQDYRAATYELMKEV